jgi:Outer membrane protein (OmpH-like).
MTKKFLVLIFFLILFSNVHAEDQKIVYLNVDKIMQQSLAGKSIKQQLKKIYDNNLENFKKNDEILRKKEKKIINQKNILSQRRV